jgi:DNA-binding transcriptional ArsR family regulator
MEERRYRESRVCRLGNPVVYQLVLFLDKGGPLTPSKLAKIAGRSIQTVSGHLGKLRAADLVRYDTEGKQVRYWLKHERDTSRLLKALETIVTILKQTYLRFSFRRFDNSRNVEAPLGTRTDYSPVHDQSLFRNTTTSHSHEQGSSAFITYP